MQEEGAGVSGCHREVCARGEAVGLQARLPKITRLLQVVQREHPSVPPRRFFVAQR